jgi:2-polyprenyl-3-methyl-5-hydroxy-6-metoxy-1,4-benzoquinol methylase
LNQYGDKFKPTDSGRGVDISSQRQDELDLNSLAFIRERVAAGEKIQAVDLGGGFGAHSIQMAAIGACVTMVDIADMAADSFKRAIGAGIFCPENLRFIQKDFMALTDIDIPENYDLLYSQRAIHHVPYMEARKILLWMFTRMRMNGAIFISAGGWDTEYGKTYLDRDKPIEQRFNFVMPDMQQKFGFAHKIVTYKEEEMTVLLEDVGFSDIHVTRSPFGNIKAMARKI